MSKKNEPSKGTLNIEGELATISFERTLRHSPERVWRAITDPDEMKLWFMSVMKIHPGVGGQMELISGPSRFHSVGKILVWEPLQVLEYEWKVSLRPELPEGEDAIVRWELRPIAVGTQLFLTYRKLTKPTALGFLPGMHIFLERLAAQLEQTQLPEWASRLSEIKELYPEWQTVGKFK